MKKLIILSFLSVIASMHTYAQRKPMESSLLIGYQKYFPVYPLGLLELGYSGFFEHESLTSFTKRSRFNANALFNPGRGLVGVQVGGSYSYLFAAGFNVNVIRQVPIVERTWQANLNPFVGLDFWFCSFHIGYNLQVELRPPLTPDPPPIGRLNYTINMYLPLKRNKSMYR